MSFVITSPRGVAGFLKPSRSAQRRSPQRRRWAWLALGAFVVPALVFLTLTARRPAPAPPSAGLAIGAPVPKTALTATTGGAISLADLHGSKVVVFFYEGAG